MEEITLDEIEAAAQIVYAEMQATPQYCWPLLCERLGTEVWVKHENHTPNGAFKIRGGLVYFAHLANSAEKPRGVVSATRGNHGQSVGFAARRYGISTTIVVPHGNSLEKNAAMRSLGVKLLEHGDEFQTAREFAINLAREEELQMVPSFDPLLVTGVATYSLELLSAVEDIDIVYVPIGLGSGICGMLAARDALNLKTEIVGVVSAHATAYAESFSSGRPVESPVSTKIADGMACRTPEQSALEMIWKGVTRIVKVSDSEIAEAMRMMFECTHNVCEGAGAAATAAALQESSKIKGRKVAVIASGGNVDRDVFAAILNGENFAA
ncbi:MAG: threonine dehydratase [SAR324 cluster bacterium]|jgi:threonine dehydratase|nr:threonine dehydratase [SAR324 cluster bacterium]MCH2265059.1 threonine dehydratase [SAR324 cluster bacterium]